MNNQLCKDNVICCDDNCQRCANLIYNKYVELQEENKRLKQEYEPRQHGEWIPIVSYFHGKPTGKYYCSVCHRVETMKGIYCRLCGADMNGGNK